MYLSFPNPQVSIADNVPVEFNELSSTGIAFDPITYRFTLGAGKKYKLVNSPAIDFSSINGFISFAWYDHGLDKTFGVGGEIFAGEGDTPKGIESIVSKKFETFFETIGSVDVSLIIIASQAVKSIARDNTFVYIEEVNSFTNVVLAVGGGSAYPRVSFFSELPSPITAMSEIYVVEQKEGTIPGIRKLSGFYLSDGIDWNRIGNLENSSAIKSLYEANINTNVFTDTDKDIVQKFNLTGVQDGDILVYNSVSGEFEPSISSSVGNFTPKDDRFTVTNAIIISREISLSFIPVTGSDVLFMNGQYCKRNIHYTISGKNITIDNSVSLSTELKPDIIDVVYWI